MKEKVIVKIIYPDRTEEFDVSEGYILLFTPDGQSITEHGFVYDTETRGAFAATTLINLPDKEYRAAIEFAEEERQARNISAKKAGLAVIKGGQSVE